MLNSKINFHPFHSTLSFINYLIGSTVAVCLTEYFVLFNCSVISKVDIKMEDDMRGVVRLGMPCKFITVTIIVIQLQTSKNKFTQALPMHCCWPKSAFLNTAKPVISKVTFFNSVQILAMYIACSCNYLCCHNDAPALSSGMLVH